MVANHLNDISKDHPRLAIELARGWMARSDGAAWVVRHGLRTLVKRGGPDSLELLGVAPDAAIRVTDLAIDRSQVPIGDAATFTFTVELSPRQPGAVDAVMDYRVHYVGATGVKAPEGVQADQAAPRAGHPRDRYSPPPVRARVDPSHPAGTPRDRRSGQRPGDRLDIDRGQSGGVTSR